MYAQPAIKLLRELQLAEDQGEGREGPDIHKNCVSVPSFVFSMVTGDTVYGPGLPPSLHELPRPH